MDILTGCDDEDDDGDPGYERDAVQRREDCARVRDLLADGLSPDARGKHGESLLYRALEYDHRHAEEMIRVVVEAGCDVNAPTHDSSDELPLDCELWLELDGPFAQANRRKRDYLISHGARHSTAVAARMARDEADAANAAAVKEAALDQRLIDARREWQAERSMPLMPTWDDS